MLVFMCSSTYVTVRTIQWSSMLGTADSNSQQNNGGADLLDGFRWLGTDAPSKDCSLYTNDQHALTTKWIGYLSFAAAVIRRRVKTGSQFLKDCSLPSTVTYLWVFIGIKQYGRHLVCSSGSFHMV
jgi:hypothetical protein